MFPLAPNWAKLAVLYVSGGLLSALTVIITVRGIVALLTWSAAGVPVWIFPRMLDEARRGVGWVVVFLSPTASPGEAGEGGPPPGRLRRPRVGLLVIEGAGPAAPPAEGGAPPPPGGCRKERRGLWDGRRG